MYFSKIIGNYLTKLYMRDNRQNNGSFNSYHWSQFTADICDVRSIPVLTLIHMRHLIVVEKNTCPAMVTSRK